jgi:NADH-quinone oxidoreductase subunit D
MLRSTGIEWDIRKNEDYEIYSEIPFNSVIGEVGDSFDRYLMRVCEMRESLRIIKYCIDNIPEGPIKNLDFKYSPVPRKLLKSSMEGLIHHFKYFTEGFTVPVNGAYTAIESPKGEFGVYLVSNNTNKPYRLKFRSPGYFNLQALQQLGQNLMLADIVTLIGTIDIVFGEIDR